LNVDRIIEPFRNIVLFSGKNIRPREEKGPRRHVERSHGMMDDVYVVVEAAGTEAMDRLWRENADPALL
jgi:hypothetical protein